jgi:hypothetical protein
VDAGFSSHILRSGSTCLRLPRSAAAAERWRGVTRFLDAIGGHLAVELPTLIRKLDATWQYPHGGQLEQWLDGHEANASVDPRSVASFIGNLHEIDPDLALQVLPGFSDWCYRHRRVRGDPVRHTRGPRARGADPPVPPRPLLAPEYVGRIADAIEKVATSLDELAAHGAAIEAPDAD